ncbi:cysteine desulfurase [Hyphomonas sp. WL0036]|uniref:cysteine desulfurase family protein n=1 Tax=Hyphomonas sediminis TaxID=2866160 RepID=UPI001C7EB504|nr:cysteine desulfurase family protein [Hyphomonas sediminis]MBY9066894.1 cysteine desulfurase [Hyphomonas sediminis]
MIYADYNATAPLKPQAREAMLAALDLGPVNPSSVHSAGRAARAIVEKARGQVGAAIGSRAEDIVFTSGGTESLALAIQGAVAGLNGAATLIVSAIEHDAATKAAAHSGVPVETAYVLPIGQVDLDDLRSRLASWDRALKGTPILVLMLANNETGILQPVAEAAALIREAGGLTVCDAVQGLGKVAVNVALLGVDYLALSAHKVGGPQGAGALWHRAGAPLKAVQYGGGQERGLRSGTENVAAIAGFGAVMSPNVLNLTQYGSLSTLRDTMEARLKSEGGVTVIGEGSPRLAGVSCFARPGFRAETQVMALDLAGVCISAGSACSSGKVKRSLVLMAMGADDALAESAIRTSFGWNSRPEDFTRVADAWIEAARRTVLKETV